MLQRGCAMGGRPRARPTSEEVGFDHFKLNLTPEQLNTVARKLALPDDVRGELAAEGGTQPADGQEVMLTFKGRYVRITYQQGRAVSIKPDDQ
jgi:hypothetical protein